MEGETRLISKEEWKILKPNVKYPSFMEKAWNENPNKRRFQSNVFEERFQKSLKEAESKKDQNQYKKDVNIQKHIAIKKGETIFIKSPNGKRKLILDCPEDQIKEILTKELNNENIDKETFNLALENLSLIHL